MDIPDKYLREDLVERFTRYVKIDTASDRHSKTFPTTAVQFELADILRKELIRFGLKDVDVDDNSYLIAKLPSSLRSGGKIMSGYADPPVIGLMAHLDTSDAVPGNNVRPVLHENYNGGVIRLNNSIVLDPKEFPELRTYRGDTVITSDGSTLLGADDKAGLAEIMTAIRYLTEHPEIPHGEIEIIFTPDEETGMGMSRFPLKKVKSKYCYTVDGGEEGSIEPESFNAYKVAVTFHGRSIHIGYARGKLINALNMARDFLSMLPGAETPEATDGRFGYYCPFEISGKLDRVFLEVYIRDFDDKEAARRIEVINSIAQTVEKIYPGSRIEVKPEKQYSNMKRYIDSEPRIVSILEKAVEKAGAKPLLKYIRGGTDGSQLSEMGIPTPNIFAGGYNFHSRLEWVPVSSMVKAARTLINLAALWTAET